MAAPEDPYVCLGIAPGASLAEIKRAYRRAAQLHHPDRNPGSATAHEQFIRVQWAYETLLQAPEGAPYTPPSPSPPEPVIVPAAGPQEGAATIEIGIPLEKVGQPFEKVVSAKLAHPCPVCNGTSSGVCTRCHGTGQILQTRRWRIIVPARTPDGAWLVGHAMGHVGPRSGKAGDVRVQVRWKDTGVWSWEDTCLVARVKLSASRLRKGGRHPLRMPDGQWIWWTLPPQTQAGQWFKCPALAWGGGVCQAWVRAEKGWALFSPGYRRGSEKS